MVQNVILVALLSLLRHFLSAFQRQIVPCYLITGKAISYLVDSYKIISP